MPDTTFSDPILAYASATVTVVFQIPDGDDRFDLLLSQGLPSIPSHFTDPDNYGPGDFYIRPKTLTVSYHRDRGPGWSAGSLQFYGVWVKDGRVLQTLPHIRTRGPVTGDLDAGLDDSGVNDTVRDLVAAHMPTGDPFAR